MSAALGMTVLILFRMPASGSQAILGAIVGGALARGSTLDAEIVTRLVRGWALTPALAAGIARICVVDFAAENAVVRVEKPGALRFAESVGVEIHRSRADFEGG